MSLAAIIGIAISACALPVIWLLGRRADEARSKRFEAREELPITEEWGPWSAEVGIPMAAVIEALGHIEKVTGIAKDRLRPNDRFDVELSPSPGWEFDDALTELAWDLKRQPGQHVETVADFVQAFSQGRRKPITT